MMRLPAALAWLALGLAGAHAAGDYSSLYDRATLEQWAPRYARSTTRIYEEVVAPALLAQEKQRLRAVRLEFPLHGEGAARRHPLQFYVPPDGARVVMPVASLKFLDDLCTAYAWLQVNGYTLETISEYTAMLRYREFPGGRYPQPLDALRIPRDALRNPRVDELALGHFVTARTFILLHEIGHLLPPRAASSIENEKRADRFAADVMRRTPLPPLGIIVFFMFDAHWAGYPATAEDTHPSSGERLRALSSRVDDRALGEALRRLGELMDDREIRAGLAAAGRATGLEALAPRRPGELPRISRAAPSGVAAFDGRYLGHGTQLAERKAFALETVLERRGDRVEGQYSFGLGVGALAGKVSGDTLAFEWTWAGNYGRGVLKASRDGSAFTGTWGYRESADNAGTWDGRR